MNIVYVPLSQDCRVTTRPFWGPVDWHFTDWNGSQFNKGNVANPHCMQVTQRELLFYSSLLVKKGNAIQMTSRFLGLHIIIVTLKLFKFLLFWEFHIWVIHITYVFLVSICFLLIFSNIPSVIAPFLYPPCIKHPPPPAFASYNYTPHPEPASDRFIKSPQGSRLMDASVFCSYIIWTWQKKRQ